MSTIVLTCWNMDRTGGMQVLAVEIARDLKRRGYGVYIVSDKRGAFSLYHNDIEVFTPHEIIATEGARKINLENIGTPGFKPFIEIVPFADAAIVMHPRVFQNITLPGRRAYITGGWSEPEAPIVGTGPYVCLCDEVCSWLEFLGIEATITRGLISKDKFEIGPPLRDTQPVVFEYASRPLDGQLVRKACEILGFTYLDWPRISPLRNVNEWLNKADIVVGTETCAVEAAMCGRATLVAGNRGIDGWLTPDNYEQMVAHALRGTMIGTDTTVDNLVHALNSYDPFAFDRSMFADLISNDRDIAQMSDLLLDKLELSRMIMNGTAA